jgi:hypothetical protein
LSTAHTIRVRVPSALETLEILANIIARLLGRKCIKKTKFTSFKDKIANLRSTGQKTIKVNECQNEGLNLEPRAAGPDALPLVY